jgi:uncharacterized membrane protein
MPYTWTSQPNDPTQVMHLKPHESLSPKGMAAFILATFTLILIPALALLGTRLLWALLPFLLLAVWGMYFALQQNHKQRQILEVLTLEEDSVKSTPQPKAMPSHGTATVTGPKLPNTKPADPSQTISR